MVSFTATYTSATGQQRTLNLKATDAVTARRLLRRRGIKANDIRQNKISLNEAQSKASKPAELDRLMNN